MHSSLFRLILGRNLPDHKALKVRSELYGLEHLNDLDTRPDILDCAHLILWDWEAYRTSIDGTLFYS